MPKLEFIEKKIAAIEGFAVTFHYSGPAKAKGRDVRGDRRDVPTYPYRRKMKADATVAAWADTRFRAKGGCIFDDGAPRLSHEDDPQLATTLGSRRR